MLVEPFADDRVEGNLNPIGRLYYSASTTLCGEHCRWAVLEAESEHQAGLAVPPLLRGKARVVRLDRFTADEVRSFHTGE